MAFTLTSADERKLVGVDVRLVAVVRAVARVYDGRFMVVEGLRTRERQMELFRDGKSRTLNSKHLVGRAVDLAPMRGVRVSWNWSDFTPLVVCVKRESAAMKVALTFGYDWGWDAPHMELKE